MSSITSIARSGLTAAVARVDAAANNIANQQTPEYRRQQVRQAEAAGGGVQATTVRAETAGDDRIETDLIQQKSASYEFKANLRVLKTGEEILGTLLDTRA